MNLLEEGAHAAADWLRYRLDELGDRIVVHVHPEGWLAAVPPRAKRPPGYILGPVPVTRARYTARVACMSWLRASLVQLQAADREADR
ncbi:MAG TPA: hypothetical protein VFE72_02935 [Lysobacter sp.]|nr:hypothetical protein [Lysobacter sp.]